MEENKISTPELEEDKMKDVNTPAAQEEEESLADSVRIVSPGRLVMKRFFRSRLSMVGLVSLIVLFIFAFVGPIFSPWGEIEMDMSIPEDKRETYIDTSYTEKLDATELFRGAVERKLNGSTVYKIPDNPTPLEGVTYDNETKIGYYTPEGSRQRVYFYVKTSNGTSTVSVCDENGEVRVFRSTEYTWDHKPFNQLGKIDSNHWLGTDEQGMDVFTRLMYGGRVSLTLGFVVVILETFLGIIFGGLAGYFGKWVDQLIMRIVDIFNCIPTFPILLILSAVLEGMDIDQKFQIYYLMVIMTLLGWSGVARVVRGQILFLREQEFMVAAEALGLSVPRKIFRHLLPNILPQLIVQMTLGLGSIILTESTLSYLGIGIPIPYAAWGTMISSAQKPEILENYPNLWVPAGILIVIAVLAFNFIGDGLRDAFDPKASR